MSFLKTLLAIHWAHVAGPVPFWTQRHTSEDTGLIMAAGSSGFLGEVAAATHRSRPSAVITAPSASGIGPAGLGLVPQFPSSASSDGAASPGEAADPPPAGYTLPPRLAPALRECCRPGFFSFTILFLSNLHTPRGAPAHSPEIRSRALHGRSQPGDPGDRHPRRPSPPEFAE